MDIWGRNLGYEGLERGDCIGFGGVSEAGERGVEWKRVRGKGDEVRE